MIDNGNKPKHFQKLFTQSLFQTGYSRFYDTSRSQDFSLGWKSIQCSKKNSRKTWQLNEFLPFPLERGTIRSILKVLYYSGKIKDGRQFPSMIFKTQAYIAVLVLRSSTSLVFSLSFSSTFFFLKTDRSLVQLILGVLHDFILFFVYRPIHSVSSSFARHHTKKFSGRWMLIAAWTSGAARRWLKQGKCQSCKKYWKQTKGLSRTCSIVFGLSTLFASSSCLRWAKQALAIKCLKTTDTQLTQNSTENWAHLFSWHRTPLHIEKFWTKNESSYESKKIDKEERNKRKTNKQK